MLRTLFSLSGELRDRKEVSPTTGQNFGVVEITFLPLLCTITPTLKSRPQPPTPPYNCGADTTYMNILQPSGSPTTGPKLRKFERVVNKKKKTAFFCWSWLRPCLTLLKVLLSDYGYGVSLRAFLACRLIPLNKNPGVSPIRETEVSGALENRWKGSHASVVPGSAGPLQLCCACGQECGAEAALRCTPCALRAVFQQDSTDAALQWRIERF